MRYFLILFLFCSGVTAEQGRFSSGSGSPMVPAPWYPQDPVDPGTPGDLPFPDPIPPQGPHPVQLEDHDCCEELQILKERLKRMRFFLNGSGLPDNKPVEESADCEVLLRRVGNAVYNYNFDRETALELLGELHSFKVLLEAGYLKFIPHQYHRFRVKKTGEGKCTPRNP